MARYRIVCVVQVLPNSDPEHARIIRVGLGNNPSRAEEIISVAEVLKRMERGDTFFTHGEESREDAEVISFWCHRCFEEHIKSVPDAVEDNNLDELRECRQKRT